MRASSFYYQATIHKKRAWFFVAILRSFEHLVFDRTVDKDKSVFEFFVPADNEAYFVQLMKELEARGVVSGLIKMENRLVSSFG